MTKPLTLPVAKKLTRRHVSLASRRAVLAAFRERAETLMKKIDVELKPAIEAELQAQNVGNKVAVVVETKGIEVQKYDRESPKYKDICEELVSEKLLDQLLRQTDRLGNFLYKTVSTTFKSKLLGPVQQ